MSHQGRRRHNQEIRGSQDKINSLQARSSSTNPPVESGPSPLVFNWGDQYMAETLASMESIIAINEVELVREYETY